MSDVTRILTEIESGKASTVDLLPVVYNQLRALAARELAHEKPGQTLQPTALVHEAFLRLVGEQHDRHWNGRNHFFMAAAEAMRRILVDNARRKDALKAGGGRRRVPLPDVAGRRHASQLDLLALHEALERLEHTAPRRAQLVKLRFFAGLTLDQAAHVLQISISTADDDWAYAKSWLRVALKEGESRS